MNLFQRPYLKLSFVLVITNRYNKLIKETPLDKRTALIMENTIVVHWIFHVGTPHYIISDKDSNFICMFFAEICSALGVPPVYNAEFHSQKKGPA